MSLCINPACLQPNHPDNDENRFCQSCGSQLELIGRFRVMRLLSDKTGFSNVYEAYELDTPKILKVLKDELANNNKAVSLFQQEATVLRQLNHPGIPKSEGYFQYQTRLGMVLHCLVMEKIEGPNLEQWLRQQQNRPISQGQAITWLKQLAEILLLVHDNQYLHRDIKPSNIMIRPDGQLVLIDFGTAREITRTYLAQDGGMTAIMSSGYSAPEQRSGQAVPQSDFFALGTTFVFLLTGIHPEDLYDPRLNTLQWRHHATHVSPILLNFIDWLMSPFPEKRPLNARDILQRLGEIESQLLGNTSATVNVVGNLQTEVCVNPPSTHHTVKPQPKEPEKLTLLAWLAALIVSLGLLWSVALATRNTRFAALPPDYGQLPEKKGKVDYFPYEEGKDSQGRVAEFNIAVLSVEYKWQLGSTYQIRYNDRLINLDDLRNNLEQEGIQKIMENPHEIISVGTASCEGDVATEQSRALERSKQIQLLAKKLFRNTPSVKGYRLLNLGQFQRKDCQGNQDLTAYQRSIIIIGVKKQSEGVILDEALRDRLEKKPFADFKLADYSLGSPQQFKTIPSNLN
ncbi:serine/threonine protein kinase [Richelia sinica FACHB-800]|uniref:Serine/threonine protein kinase n=1 Tax=Richelia sinica FACHB-800 TaxID=1357546 RepID=A0A975T856_9NOST|nr:serine/threonine-protein kinase [Richelia sinica]MBD2667461.1 serine/threonine protein kinase [Richelia sinica FACHB-800]QXE23845.1 serine/threonine protein kinase [Richelia sinica FACHB-800]